MTPEAVFGLASEHMDDEAAIVATAIAWAESGLNPDAVGDESLVDETWGPSIGLWQIRSLHAQEGTSGERDRLRLKEPAFNAKSMATISAGGTNWTPWSVFKNGRYRQHLDAVRAAVQGQGGRSMKFVSRAEWGARAGSSSTSITPVGVAVHWEGPHMGTPEHGSCAGIVRGFQAFHMDTNGWADIAYSAVVCPHGYVFEGRGPGHRTAANGTNDGNQRFYAVCFMGGEGDTFTDEAKDGINDAIEWLGGGEITGHRDHTETACPGDEIYAWVQSGHPRAGGTDPEPLPEPQQEDDGMKLIAVTEDRGIFLAGENVGEDGKIPARHVGTPDEVTALVEAGAVVNYDKRPALPASVFDTYYRVVG